MNIPPASPLVALSADEAIEAMRELNGYFDITPHDFQELYRHAHALVYRRILTERKARHIMRSPPLVALDWWNISKLIDFFAKHAISGAPVADDLGILRGVVSEKDILEVMSGCEAGNDMGGDVCRVSAAEGWPAAQAAPAADALRSLEVKDVMSAPAVHVEEQTALADVLRLFRDNNINRVPVTDGQGRPSGIITRADLISAFAALV